MSILKDCNTHNRISHCEFPMRSSGRINFVMTCSNYEGKSTNPSGDMFMDNFELGRGVFPPSQVEYTEEEHFFSFHN